MIKRDLPRTESVKLAVKNGGISIDFMMEKLAEMEGEIITQRTEIRRLRGLLPGAGKRRAKA